MHVGARYYDAQVGRFITRDTDLDQKPYLYCEHDPINAIDPSGHMPLNWNRVFRLGDEWWYREGEGGDSWYRKLSADEIDELLLLRPSGPPSGNLPRVPVDTPSTPDPQLPRVPGGGDGDNFPKPPSSSDTWKTIGAMVAIPIIIIGAAVLCCFDADTPVLMADGSTRNIQDIRPGDWVLSADPQTGKPVATQVLHTTTTEVDGAITLCFADGEQIHTTGNHLFYVAGKGFVPAAEIAPQMPCLLSAGRVSQVSKIAWDTARHHRVYNLEVSGYHTYFVGKLGVLVHDKTATHNAPRLR